MNIFSGLQEIVKTDSDLSNYTWLGLGGRAEYFVTPRSVEELQTVMVRCRENSLPVHVLGFGSNLLVSDEGVRGAVIKLESDEFTKTEYEGEQLTAWAGVNLSKLVLECVRKGLGGLESLTGIPGSIGGAVRMNAGGNWGDIGACVDSVTLMSREGEIFEKAKPELIFDYRSVNITAPLILNAKMKLVESDSDQLLRTVKEIWIYKKNSQPLNTKNAGCVFKNPRGLSAGALIDRAGLKGLKIGGAQVSEQHANFLVTEKGCKSADVKKLIDIVRNKVQEEFDVQLELELEIW
ncbi:UDP-N-acetylenolpyruvoylglucosamine reductase [Anaerohalosphaera lusitana]|uniref:UDP-N-acetylenolpyruvoylglucosamine reductase n=1 Tax=Anaerohalosphaera lusitana TaxID=1936003 RepID=A0A1U9NQV5_9BACT|nr:UDP-N-acetylmuramate dehydrogenase [Anaerohalosphaera lusitana]AQT70205.1 UDP-N-acetylenolpyruvoylglucosamine reductase [Anaerohalosphaera lusitana]